MIETYFLLPQQDNDGNPFPRAKFQALRERIISEFGGLTVEEDHSTGYWKGDDGRLYADRNAKYIIAVESLTQIPAVLDLVRWVRKEFQQEAIYLNIAGIAEIIGEEA